MCKAPGESEDLKEVCAGRRGEHGASRHLLKQRCSLWLRESTFPGRLTWPMANFKVCRPLPCCVPSVPSHFNCDALINDHVGEEVRSTNDSLSSRRCLLPWLSLGLCWEIWVPAAPLALLATLGPLLGCLLLWTCVRLLALGPPIFV